MKFSVSSRPVAIAALVLGSLLLLGFWPGPRVPPATGATNGITISWLDQQLPLWQKATVYPMTFSAQFPAASYNNLNPLNFAALTADLNLLYGTGASMIRIDVGYDAWLQNNQTRMQMLTKIAQNITSSGRELVLADASAESYRTNQVPWTTFKAEWVQRVQTLARQFQPNYYIVIKEPGWYVPFVSDVSTNPYFKNATDWADLSAKLASAVHTVSPKTIVGVSVAASDMGNYPQFYDSFIQQAAGNPQIGFTGFDIYTASGFTITQDFLTTHGVSGKSTWIAEAWSGSGQVAFNESRSSLDSLFMDALYYYGLTIHAAVINPFYTDCFASYQAPPSNSQALISYFANRTPAFYEYGKLIQSQAQAQSSTSSTSSQTTSSTGATSSTTRNSSSSTLASTSSSASTAQNSSLPTTVVQTNNSATTRASTRAVHSGAVSGSTTSTLAIGLVFLGIVAVVALLYIRRARGNLSGQT